MTPQWAMGLTLMTTSCELESPSVNPRELQALACVTRALRGFPVQNIDTHMFVTVGPAFSVPCCQLQAYALWSFASQRAV